MKSNPKIEIDYKPADVGKKILNSRGKMVAVRKYHLTKVEMNKAKQKFDEITKKVSKQIKDAAGFYFFNPYRFRGVYYAQLQALYLLGANKWHPFGAVRDKMKEFASTVKVTRRDRAVPRETDVWTEFERKTAKPTAVTSKDVFGRINENMVFLQRLSKLHPYGYKLRQVRAAVDIKRVSKEGFPNGIFYYRLSTYETIREAIPIKDSSQFVPPNTRGRKYGSRNKKKTPLPTMKGTVVDITIKNLEGSEVL